MTIRCVLLQAFAVIESLFLRFLHLKVDVTDLVRYALKVADPEVARVQDGVVLQGRAVGTTVVQVRHQQTCVCISVEVGFLQPECVPVFAVAGVVPCDVIGPG